MSWLRCHGRLLRLQDIIGAVISFSLFPSFSLSFLTLISYLLSLARSPSHLLAHLASHLGAVISFSFFPYTDILSFEPGAVALAPSDPPRDALLASHLVASPGVPQYVSPSGPHRDTFLASHFASPSLPQCTSLRLPQCACPNTCHLLAVSSCRVTLPSPTRVTF